MSNSIWKVGTQLVTWSYMEGFETPVDRLNARDQTYPSSEYEDTKLSSTGIFFSQGIGDGALELMFIPVGKVNINPQFTDYLFTGGQYLRDSTLEHSKWASRFIGSIHKLDYAISYIDGTDLQADTDLLDANGKVMSHNSSTSTLQLVADISRYSRPARTYHRVRNPGFDLQYNWGSWIPKMAYVQYLIEDKDGNNPFIKNNWSQYMLGGEFIIASAKVNFYAGQILVENYKEDTPLDLKTNFLNGQKRDRTDFVSGYVDADFLTGNALKLNQLEDQPILGAGYTSSIRSWQKSFDLSYRINWLNSLSIDLGNLYTGASIASLIQLGKNYPENFNMVNWVPTNRFRVESNFNSPPMFIGWSFVMGAYLNMVNHLYIIDCAPDHDIERDTYVGNSIIGLHLHFDRFQISFNIQTIQLTLNRDNNIDKWGRITLSWF